MILNKDVDLLKHLNKELRKYKVKLCFKYYPTCPFSDHQLEIMELIIKYADCFDSYHHRIFILSSLCDEHFKDSVPYLVKTYHYFLSEVYSVPKDEMYLLFLCDTIAKINALEYIDLYESMISRPMTQSAESIIIMLSKMNVDQVDDMIFDLIKKENLIPKAWFGELNEDSKYWCSLVALKCIVNKKKDKYLAFFNELVQDKDMAWIKFVESKYKSKLTLEMKKKYKVLAEKGIKQIQSATKRQ